MQGRSVGLGPLRLRVVENAILVPGGGILGPDGSTLPDGQLRGGLDRMLFHGEAQITPVTPTVRIEGEACYLGWHIGHFGHFLIESMARWWATSHLPDAIPLFWLSVPGARQATTHARLSALGIDPERASLVTEPTRVRRLLIPDVTFERNHYIHEDAARPFREIADRLCGSPPLTDQPLYLSRSRLGNRNRRLEDEVVFDEYLGDEGVRVVHPETLPLAEQLRIVRSHRTIIGPWGSAMHLLNFTEHRPATWLLTGNDFRENYLLWADALDAPLTFVYCLTGSLRRSPPARGLVPFDLEKAAMALHAEGLVSNPSRVCDLLAKHGHSRPGD
jgi:hypothetical protein